MQKIMITGCSSGFGLDLARTFLDRGWAVVATMRKPDAKALPQSEKLQVLELDVTQPATIARAIAKAGPVDVLVNNAGFGVPSPVELTDPDTAEALFRTNTLGTLAMMQAVLPSLRQRRTGVIINISSSTTLKPLPLVGLYRASKMAVNAMTESLAVEVKPFNIRVHLVLPGRAPETRFGDTAMAQLRGRDDADYGPMIQRILHGMHDRTGPVTHPSDVTEAVWRAATDPSAPFQIAAGADAEAWLADRLVHPAVQDIAS